VRFVDRHVWRQRAVLALAPWPFVRACTSRAEIRRDPRRAAVRAAYLVAYAAALVAIAALVPLLLLPVGLAVAGATLLVVAYARPSYGVRRSLPPGSLPLVSTAVGSDHDFFAKEAARYGPVFKAMTAVLTEPAVCVVGLPLGLSALRENEARLGPTGLSFDSLIPRKLLRSMSREDHLAYRPLFQAAIHDDVVDACRRELDAIVATGLAELAEASVSAAGRGVWPRDHLESIVADAFVRLFLGLAPRSEAGRRVADDLRAIGIEVGGGPRSRRYREVDLLASRIEDVIRTRGAAIEREDGDAPSASFLATLLSRQPAALDDPTITRNLVFLMRTALTDLTGLLHWIVKLVGDNPESLAELRRSAAPDELALGVVMETLRLEQSELVFRDVEQPIQIAGYTVPAGWHLRLCVHESHRDPAVFSEPDRFDPTRFAHRFNRHEYSPFGALGHSCLGVTTTHVIAATFVRQLACGYDLAVVADGPAEFNQHWRPSRRHRVMLRRLDSAAG
jgi:cytochrome P450